MPPDWPVWKKAGTDDVTVPGSSRREGPMFCHHASGFVPSMAVIYLPDLSQRLAPS